MTGVRTLATTGQRKVCHPLLLGDHISPYFPERDAGASTIGEGDDNTALPLSYWREVLTTLDAGREHAYKNRDRYLQTYWISMLIGAEGQPEVGRVLHSSPRTQESPIANAVLGYIRKHIILSDLLEQLDALVRWKEEWQENKHEPEKPSELALTNAKQVVEELYDVVVIAEDRPWHTPFISYDQDGYITLVWRNGTHELYLEVTEGEIQYVKVWGINIDSEMDAGVPSRDNYLTLWEWLLDG